MSILVIGGGWSGLAAAVRLSQQGQAVHLLESAKQLGGRARSVSWQDLQIDNGQHLLIGAYQRTLALLEDIGAKEAELFERQALDIMIHDPRYPPLHIAAGRSLPWPLSLAWRLLRDNNFNTLRQVLRLNLQARRFSAQADSDVESWLKQAGQSSRLISQLWEPLCLAMLNTPISTASAKLFANALNETFAQRAYSDLLIPRKPLGEVLPVYAARFLHRQGSQLSLQSRVSQLIIEAGKIKGVRLSNGRLIEADQVILATQPTVTRQLLTGHVALPVVHSYPITTVYLQYPSDYRLPSAMMGLSGTLSQWLFDRSDLRPGLMAVVISGPGEHQNMDKAALSLAVAREVNQLVPVLPAAADKSMVIREKRATFACNVDIQAQRPNNRTEITGLWLAGDFVANPYPATLEGAVFNGEQTAIQLMEHLSVSR